MSVFGFLGTKAEVGWELWKLLKKIPKWIEEGKMLPDGKKVTDSKTLWGQTLKLIGALFTALAAVLASSSGTGLQGILSAIQSGDLSGVVMTISALVGVLGALVQKRGERDQQGRIEAELKALKQ